MNVEPSVFVIGWFAGAYVETWGFVMCWAKVGGLAQMQW
jgi:hypothetical protein